jgi:hypothetical protein
MDITTTTIGLIVLAAVAALAVVGVWPRRRPMIVGPTSGRSTRPVRSGSRSSHQWFGGDPVYYLGGDAGSADCGAGADGGGGGGCD